MSVDKWLDYCRVEKPLNKTRVFVVLSTVPTISFGNVQEFVKQDQLG